MEGSQKNEHQNNRRDERRKKWLHIWRVDVRETTKRNKYEEDFYFFVVLLGFVYNLFEGFRVEKAGNQDEAVQSHTAELFSCLISSVYDLHIISREMPQAAVRSGDAISFHFVLLLFAIL